MNLPATMSILCFLVFSSQTVTSQVMVETKNETLEANSTEDHDDYDDYGCANDEFDCGNAECILQSQVCDKIVDCGDGADEANCTGGIIECNNDQVDCGDGFCIYKHQLCDGNIHCFNGTDEKNCDSSSPVNTTTIPVTTTTEELSTIPDEDYELDCSDDEFACLDLCINIELVCDGKSDCLEGEDEFNCSQDVTTTVKTESSTSRQIDTSKAPLTSSIPPKIETTRSPDSQASPSPSPNNVFSTTLVNKILTRATQSSTSDYTSSSSQGCFYEEKWYPAGSDIVPGKCDGVLCTTTNKVVVWSDPTCAACSARISFLLIVILTLSCIILNWR
uniref:low-density lipoprotein receptor-related protein 4-like isoform X1 n=1 Tax=Styela clava TaxID=7725 RepID=UPI00193ADC25|nr:low-density lipoprotein receptor-related protein 4-like isoform X1 [Styela clava]